MGLIILRLGGTNKQPSWAFRVISNVYNRSNKLMTFKEEFIMLKKFDSFAWMGIMIIGVMITIMTTPMRIQELSA